MKLTDDYFTYGFEIEGLFGNQSFSTLPYTVEFKGDGSVQIARIQAKYPFLQFANIYGGGARDYTEANVGVFDNLESMLKALQDFVNGANYFMDESCGLHVHIKSKKNIIETRDLFWDFEMVQKLEKFAFTKLCPCVKNRDDAQFCRTDKYFSSFFDDYKDKTKYKFVRNHPSGTMEFRFFSPCSHKVENVREFIEYLLTLLSKQQHKKSITLKLEADPQVVESNLAFRLTPLSTERNDFYPAQDQFFSSIRPDHQDFI